MLIKIIQALIDFLTTIKQALSEQLQAPQKPTAPPMTPYRVELKRKWDAMVVDPKATVEITKNAQVIRANQKRYELVQKETGVPWYIVGVFHMREANFNFQSHLANGDPLFDAKGNGLKTSRVPVGLGPFKSWEEGAVAALKHVGFTDPSFHWDLVNSLENIEGWNGPGYRNLGVDNPFLWAKTNFYAKGKYIADHVYDPEAVDQQLGCAPVLKALQAGGVDLAIA